MATALRPQVGVDADRHRLIDGSELELRWHSVRGCWGGRGGVVMLLACPQCGATARVLWRPPGRDWGCWRCCPVSHRSHRRSGSRAGRGKPASWRLDQLEAEQRRVADLLGLAEFPPPPLLWELRDLELAPRLPAAPRLSRQREQALLARLDALETLRMAVLMPGLMRELKGLGGRAPEWRDRDQQVAVAENQLTATAWSVRRPAQDSRTCRGRNTQHQGLP